MTRKGSSEGLRGKGGEAGGAETSLMLEEGRWAGGLGKVGKRQMVSAQLTDERGARAALGAGESRDRVMDELG